MNRSTWRKVWDWIRRSPPPLDYFWTIEVRITRPNGTLYENHKTKIHDLKDKPWRVQTAQFLRRLSDSWRHK